MKQIDKEKDRYLWLLKNIIHICLKILGLMMVLVIIFGGIDVGWTVYQRFIAEPRFILTMGDILMTFGAFMVVLIAIEIFQNIILYLRDDVIHVKIVLATALMAIARKVIILDYDELEPLYILATGVVLVATGVTYFFVYKLPNEKQDKPPAEIPVKNETFWCKKKVIHTVSRSKQSDIFTNIKCTSETRRDISSAVR